MENGEDALVEMAIMLKTTNSTNLIQRACYPSSDGLKDEPVDDEVFEELDEAPNQEERLDPLVDSDFNENLELRFREYLEFMKNLEEHQQENVDEEEEDAADYLMNDSDVEAQALMVDAVKLEHHELEHHESEHQEMERRELCRYDVLHAAKELEEPEDGDHR